MVSEVGRTRDLGRESLDVILLLLETILGYEHGEVGVFHVELADLDVEPLL